MMLSAAPDIVEHMFDTLPAVNSWTDQSALVEHIAELERIKSAAAAGQARAAAALDAARRAAEADEGWPARLRWRGKTPPSGEAGI